jgi:hypothetical protein
MRLQITTEQFHFNEMLKLIERNLKWTIRVGYNKGDLTPLLVAQYATGYLIRNINLNSMSANIYELSELLKGHHDKFQPVPNDQVILLDQVLANKFDYETIKYNLSKYSDTEVELKTIFPELDGVKTNG